MAEEPEVKRAFTLGEVAASIQQTLAKRYTSAFWVKAEMNKLNHYSHSGHCYPELVEKKNGKITTQLKSVIWKTDFERINKKFIKVLKEPLKDGIQILFLASIQFEPLYGLSLRISDVDPVFSLGELEREKFETIERLQREQLFDRNKNLSLALLPKRIAIISVESSKGYADFLKIIDENPWGYKFFHQLFPALLQGDKSIPSIIYQLSRIEKVKKHFDVVAIVRGGGGDVGLSSFNNYELSRTIAEFPIPVLSGIGHSTNETVSELVSYKYAITPTELADFLIQQFHNFAIPLQKAREKVIDIAQRTLSDQKVGLASTMKFFRSVTKNKIFENQSKLNYLSRSISQQSSFIFKRNREVLSTATSSVKAGSVGFLNTLRNVLSTHETVIRKDLQTTFQFQKINLQNLEKNISLMSPENVLNRGYTITLLNGKSVSGLSQLKEGDRLVTITKNNEIESEVKFQKKRKQNE